MVRWISFFYQNKTSVARRQKRTNPFVQSAAADVAIRGYNGKGKLSLLLSDLVVKRMAMMRDVKQRCRHMRNIGLRQWRSASGPGSIHCSSSSVRLSLSFPERHCAEVTEQGIEQGKRMEALGLDGRRRRQHEEQEEEVWPIASSP